jgi:hypothetical protein
VIALVTESSAAGPFQGAQRRLGGAGIEDSASSQASKVLPEGRGGPAGSQRGTVPAGDLLGQQDRERLGRVPALRLGGAQDLRGRRGACTAAASCAAAATTTPATTAAASTWNDAGGESSVSITGTTFFAKRAGGHGGRLFNREPPASLRFCHHRQLGRRPRLRHLRRHRLRRLPRAHQHPGDQQPARQLPARRHHQRLHRPTASPSRAQALGWPAPGPRRAACL